MRGRRLAAVLAGLMVFLSACGPDGGDAAPPPDESELPTQPASPAPPTEPEPFALAWDPGDTLDPLEAGNLNQTLVPLVFQGLFAVNSSFEAEHRLCESYTQSEDGRSWTFVLREDAVFSDGTPLTASTAAACLNAARTSALYGPRLAQVTGVSAGEGAVTVTLSAPNGALPVLLDIPIFLYQTREEGELPLGTGPYCFAGEEGELSLTRSPTWRGSAAEPETIVLRRASSADERIAAFDTGLVTLVDTDFTASNALGYSGSYESWDYPTAALLYVGFNTRQGACRDVVLRQAVSRSIDRVNTAVSLLAGHGDAASIPVSPESALYDSALAGTLDYSPAEAARLLEEGGYQRSGDGVLTLRGRPVTLNLVVNSENTFRTGVANHLAGELEKLGLTVTLSKLTWDDYIDALERGDFDLCLGQVKMTADFDPSVLLTGELNYGGFDARGVSEALEAFRAASGEARAAAGSALWTLLADQVPFAPVCFIRGSVLTRWGSVSGVTPTQNDPFYGMEHWSLRD